MYCPVAQNRIREKSTLRDAGLAVPEFREVTTAEELHAAVSELGTPSVVKTASSGYDGKGQAVVHNVDEVEEIWAELATDQAILEQFVDFDCRVVCRWGKKCARGHCSLRTVS